MIFGCDLSIEEYAKDLEKLGYTHEESIKIANNVVEWYVQTHQEFKLDEEYKRIIESIADECNKIDCTSFQMTADELKKILEDNYG